MKKLIRKKGLIVLITVAVGSQSCKKNPESCFSASKETVRIGEKISFTDCSKNTEDEFYLESIDGFGVSGSISSDMPHDLTFRKAGNHTVKYTVYGKKDREDMQTIDINVEMPTKADLIGSWRVTDVKGYDRTDYFNDNFYDYNDQYSHMDRTYTFDQDSLTISYTDGTLNLVMKDDWYIKNNDSVFDHPYVFTDGPDHEYPMFEIHSITDDQLEIIYLEDNWVIYYLEKI